MHVIRHIVSGDIPTPYYRLLSHFLTHQKMRRIARCHHRAAVRKLLLQRTGVEIGEGTSINHSVSIMDNPPISNLIIGKRVAIAAGATFICYSVPDNSELDHNLYVKERLIQKGTIVVEDDVWIGAGAIILPNVKVGRRSIIGAGAVVCGDVTPYSTIAGVPARKIRSIFEY